MYCPNCGQELKEGNLFCPNCGHAVPNAAPAEQPAPTAEEPADQAAEAPAPEAPQPAPAPFISQTQTAVATATTTAVKQQAPAQGTFEKPKEYRNLGVFVLLEFVTVGLYYLHNIVRMTKATNKDEKFAHRNPIIWLILSILFWPAHWFWLYKTGKILDDMVYQRTGKETSTAVAALILGFFQVGFIAMVLFQDRLNKAVGGATGAAPYSHGVGTCKQCGATFPDDADNCPNCGASYRRPFSHTNIFPFVIMVLGFIAFILILVAIF